MLDLKKLKALELPKKTISVNILGDDQEIEIQSLGDECAIRVSAIAGDSKIGDDERELKIRREILKSGVVGISDDDISVLMDKAAAVVTEIIIAIRDLTSEYTKIRNVTRKELEKNSDPAVSDSVSA